jgi:hypothetical protein
MAKFLAAPISITTLQTVVVAAINVNILRLVIEALVLFHLAMHVLKAHTRYLQNLEWLHVYAMMYIKAFVVDLLLVVVWIQGQTMKIVDSVVTRVTPQRFAEQVYVLLVL